MEIVYECVCMCVFGVLFVLEVGKYFLLLILPALSHHLYSFMLSPPIFILFPPFSCPILCLSLSLPINCHFSNTLFIPSQILIPFVFCLLFLLLLSLQL